MNYCSDTGNCLTVDYQKYIEDIEEKDKEITKLKMKNEELRDLSRNIIKNLKDEIKRLEEELKKYD
jgi:predicted RNase H-like nuclease (RuvC/YqgF family)